MSATDREESHRARMQRKKAVVDAAIARADRDQGLLLVLTGNGKGKSSSAFGMVARALGHGLRVGVKGGGCSGFSYILGFDEEKENDQVFEIKGIKVLMQKSHAIYLLGMEIDWEEGLNNRGFSFNNPNATDTCGCGTSFSA